MVITYLTSELIAEGARLLEALDARGIEVDAAMWYWLKDYGKWWLLLSLPRAAGALQGYASIRTTFDALPPGDLTADDVSIGPVAQDVIRDVRAELRVKEGDRPVRLQGTVSHGRWIADALVYRMRPAKPERRRSAPKRTRKRAARKA